MLQPSRTNAVVAIIALVSVGNLSIKGFLRLYI